MEKPFKLQENSYEQSKAVDQFRLLSHRKAIRPDELERHVFKAIEQQKHSSFHELIGPVLTGLFSLSLCMILFHVEN